MSAELCAKVAKLIDEELMGIEKKKPAWMIFNNTQFLSAKSAELCAKIRQVDRRRIKEKAVL